jgi:hypothetical protein
MTWMIVEGIFATVHHNKRVSTGGAQPTDKAPIYLSDKLCLCADVRLVTTIADFFADDQFDGEAECLARFAMENLKIGLKLD